MIKIGSRFLSLCIYVAVANTAVADDGAYRLDAGDILAITVHGVLGDFQSAPIHRATRGSELMPGFGHPVAVRDDGTISLPLISDLKVRGLSVSQTEKFIAKTYHDKKILTGRNLVTVYLLRKRTIRVTVVHDRQFGRGGVYDGVPRHVTQVQIPAESATPLSALAESGGRFDASQIRVYSRSSHQPATLEDGDIVDAKSPRAEYFFAAGNLRGGRHEIPPGRPINLLQAIAQAGGNVGGSGLGPSEVILSRGGRSFHLHTNQILQNPGQFIVHPGDGIMLRSTPTDVIGNSALELLRLGL